MQFVPVCRAVEVCLVVEGDENEGDDDRQHEEPENNKRREAPDVVVPRQTFSNFLDVRRKEGLVVVSETP